jgi:hypothetical protein
VDEVELGGGVVGAGVEVCPGGLVL